MSMLHNKKIQLLSSREQEILQLVGAGLANKQVAHELNLSENTIKNHKKNIFRKLGAKNSAEMIALCITIAN